MLEKYFFMIHCKSKCFKVTINSTKDVVYHVVQNNGGLQHQHCINQCFRDVIHITSNEIFGGCDTKSHNQKCRDLIHIIIDEKVDIKILYTYHMDINLIDATNILHG